MSTDNLITTGGNGVAPADKMALDYRVAGASEEHTNQLASRIAYNLLMQAAHCKDFTVRLEIYPTNLISELQVQIKDLKDMNQRLRNSLASASV